MTICGGRRKNKYVYEKRFYPHVSSATHGRTTIAYTERRLDGKRQLLFCMFGFGRLTRPNTMSATYRQNSSIEQRVHICRSNTMYLFLSSIKIAQNSVYLTVDVKGLFYLNEKNHQVIAFIHKTIFRS